MPVLKINPAVTIRAVALNIWQPGRYYSRSVAGVRRQEHANVPECSVVPGSEANRPVVGPSEPPQRPNQSCSVACSNVGNPG
jgi:hypothetical protein